MRRFSADYLERTRRGMWADSRTALSDLDLASRERVLDAGCGTGELTGVLAEEVSGDGAASATAADATVVGLDADPRLLRIARERTDLPMLVGDTTRLPVSDDSFDLVLCQALLINLPDPGAAVREFVRVSTELVAAIEPNNAQVSVDSTVAREVELERRVREAFLAGVQTNVALGDEVGALFRDAELTEIRTNRYYHEKIVEPPYTEADLEGARRKANGAGLADHEAELRQVLSDAAYDDLRREWRSMGREVVSQMQAEEYRRAEVVPFEVTVGRVERAADQSDAG